MDGHVGNTVLGLEAGALAHVPMAGLDDQRRADLAGLNDPLHLGIAPVIPAHEAHLHQPAADLQLPVDDLLAVLAIEAQGLLAEAPLFLGQSLHHIVVMGGVDGCDDHGFHLGVLDHTVAVIAEGTDAVLFRDSVGGSGHIVGNRYHGCAGNGVHDPAAVILTDGAAADNTDFQNLLHSELLPQLIFSGILFMGQMIFVCLQVLRVLGNLGITHTPPGAVAVGHGLGQHLDVNEHRAVLHSLGIHNGGF